MSEIKTLKAALAEFKKKEIKITKDKTNPYFKSKYADLSSILDVIESDLADLGVIINSECALNESGAWLCTTKISHVTDDTYMQSSFPVFGSKPQDIGSSITYARRYNIQALLNLFADDDDGNQANSSRPLTTAKEVPPASMTGEEFLSIQKSLETAENATDWEARKTLARAEAGRMLQGQKDALKRIVQKRDAEFDGVPQ